MSRIVDLKVIWKMVLVIALLARTNNTQAETGSLLFQMVSQTDPAAVKATQEQLVASAWQFETRTVDVAAAAEELSAARSGAGGHRQPHRPARSGRPGAPTSSSKASPRRPRRSARRWG